MDKTSTSSQSSILPIGSAHTIGNLLRPMSDAESAALVARYGVHENASSDDPESVDRASKLLKSFRLIARDNWPGKEPGTEDVFKSEWFASPEEAILSIKGTAKRWLRYSFALLIEDNSGRRMWVHSNWPQAYAELT